MKYVAWNSDIEIKDFDFSHHAADAESTPPEPIIDAVEPPTSGGKLSGFNYAGIASEIAEEAENVAGRIRQRLRASIIDVGNDLILVKSKLPHGSFGPWLDFHFSWSERSAQNMMNAAMEFSSAPHVVEKLPHSTIYKLAAKSTPQEVRQAIIDEIDRGTHLDPREIAQRIARSKLAASSRSTDDAASKIAPKADVDFAAGVDAHGDGANPTTAGVEVKDENIDVVMVQTVEILARKIAAALKTKLGDHFEKSRDMLLKSDLAALRKALLEA